MKFLHNKGNELLVFCQLLIRRQQSKIDQHSVSDDDPYVMTAYDGGGLIIPQEPITSKAVHIFREVHGAIDSTWKGENYWVRSLPEEHIGARSFD